MHSTSRPLSEVDSEVFQAIQKESERQQYGLEMIASENYTSRAVMEASGVLKDVPYK
ncbi:MAG: hypothetical protein AAGB31_10530, partial [Bdellovibrio sp.]